MILNPRARAAGTPELQQRIEELFRQHGFDAHVFALDQDADPMRLAREAVAAGAGVVVAGGGDGTINAVASALAGTDIPMGVLPLGTFNHFARDLKLPDTLEDAIALIAGGTTAQIDVGEVNGHRFVNNSSLGLYARIVSRRQRHQRVGYSKFWALFWAALWVFRRYPFQRVRLEIDGHPVERRTPFVFVGNNLYEVEGLAFGTRQNLAGGRLCLCVAHRTGRFGLVKLIVRALLKKLTEARDFDIHAAQEIRVETHKKKLRVALDGEVRWLEPPLEYRILPGALRVLAPSGRPESAP